MKKNQPISDAIDLKLGLAFLQTVLDKLPAIVYINELQKPGDPFSCRNVWTNKTGLDLLGYSQKEITEMGYRFYKEIMHPDDLEMVPVTVSEIYADGSMPVLVSMQRIKFQNQSDYKWLYDHGVVIDTFDDGSPRQLLVVSMDISESMHTDNPLIAALQEVKRLKSSLKLTTFTKREKEILKLIVRGKTDKDISSGLFISLQTAKKHRSNVIRKAEVKNSAELVAMAIASGLE